MQFFMYLDIFVFKNKNNLSILLKLPFYLTELRSYYLFLLNLYFSVIYEQNKKTSQK